MGLGKVISYATKWNPGTIIGCAVQYYGRNGTSDGFWDNYKKQVEALENDEYGDVVDNTAAMVRGASAIVKDAINPFTSCRKLVAVGCAILVGYLCLRRRFK